MRRRPSAVRCAALVAMIAGAIPAFAQVDRMAPPEDSAASAPAPELAESVRTALDAPYLTDAEARQMRVFHGVWTEDDLAEGDEALLAQAALVAGAWDAPVLRSETAPVLDRAEGAMHRGELREAVKLARSPEEPGIRGRRIAAECLEMLGEFDAADAEVERGIQEISGRQATAPELTDLVRAMNVRARIRGMEATDYEQMVRLLARAYQGVDRLYWPAVLAEAALLDEKDNPAEARDAVVQALSLCPSSSGATALLGDMGVRSFNFAAADQIAGRLDDIATSAGGLRPSLAGAIVRARGWIRQNQPAQGEAALDRLAGRFDKNREVMALRAALAALRYDDALLEQRLSAYDKLSPGGPLAEFEVGKALSEARQYGPAADHLHASHLRQSKWAAPLIELGLLELQAGRDMLARPYLSQANQLDPYNVRVRNSLKLIEELSTWEVVESEHFRVRFPPGDMEIMAREMLPELEEMHRIVTGVHKHEPPVKTLIELMPDNQWFAVRITGMPELFTIAAATGPVIAMEAPRDGPKAKVGVYDWVRVVRHEYTHTVTLSKTKNRLSHWFTEAAAVALELGPRDYNRSRLLAGALRNNELFTLDEINFKFVRPEKPTDRSQAYAQGHWMYLFMVERFGEEAPLRLQDEYAKGKREREAFEAALGVSPEAFFEEFVPWAEADVALWGMAPEPTLDALRLEETLIDRELRAGVRSALSDFALSVGNALVGGGVQSAYELPLVEVDEDLIAFWAAVHPDHPDLLERQLRFALEDLGGLPDESIAPLLDRYAAARPVDPMPHEMLTKVYLESSAPERAIPHLRYLDEREQYSPIYAVELANRLAAIGDFSAALESATRATTIAPFDADYRELAATIAIQAGDLHEAERHIAALVKLEPLRPIHQKRLEAVRSMRDNS